MKNGWMFLIALSGVLLICLPADSKQAAEQGYEAATVVSVKKYQSTSNYLGGNPVDAPLQARQYAYDVGIRLACNIYVGRYESATNYIPSGLAMDQPVDVRLHKHVLYVSLPGNDWDIKLGIVSHRQVRDAVCTATG